MKICEPERQHINLPGNMLQGLATMEHYRKKGWRVVKFTLNGAIIERSSGEDAGLKIEAAVHHVLTQ